MQIVKLMFQINLPPTLKLMEIDIIPNKYDILPVNSTPRRVLAVDSAVGVTLVSEETDY